MMQRSEMRQILKGVALWANVLTDRALAMCGEVEDTDPAYQVLFASALEVGELEFVMRGALHNVLVSITDPIVLEAWVADGPPG